MSGGDDGRGVVGEVVRLCPIVGAPRGCRLGAGEPPRRGVSALTWALGP